MNEKRNHISLHDMLRLMFRRRRLFLIGTALFVLAAMIVSHFLPLKYTGRSVFEFGLEAAAVSISRTSAESFDSIKERLQHDLTGNQAIEAAVTEIGLLKGLPRDPDGRLTPEGMAAKQKMVQAIGKNLHIVWEARSNQEDLISISFTHQDPLLSEQIPNVLVAAYIDRTFEKIRTGLKLQHEFLAGKVADYDKILNELTNRRIRFELEHAGLLPDNPVGLQERIQQLRSDLDMLRRKQAEAQNNLARLKALQAPSEGSAPEKNNEDGESLLWQDPVRLEQQMANLQDELENSRTILRMTDEHPTVMALRTKIAQVERRLKDAPVRAVQRFDGLSVVMAVAAAQSELESSTQEIQRLENLSSTYEGLWANFGPVRQDWLRFNKEWDDRKAEADNWRKRLQDVEVALSAVVNNRLTRMRAIQPAQRQMIPSYPSLLIIMATSIVGGLAFGGALIFLTSVLDRSITTSEQAVGEFGVPIRGVIAEIVTPAQQAVKRLRRYTIVPLLSVIILLAISGAMLSIVLKLQYPHRYEQWKESPTEYLHGEVVRPVMDKVINF